MEKRLIKKDALAGIAKKMAGDFLVWAPVKKEDNILFEPLQKDGEPYFAYLNSKNAPKNVFFPHSETLLKYTRTEKGMVFTEEVNKADQSVLFGVRPCDAHSFALLDMLFDQEKYQDGYYVAKRQNTTVISMACVKPPIRKLLLHVGGWRACFFRRRGYFADRYRQRLPGGVCHP